MEVKMIKKNEPLTESYFYILLGLYKGPNHGYGIMQETLKLSKERVKIGSGTMYGAMSNMMKKHWIEEVREIAQGGDRKRLYELTDLGREVLESERARIKELVLSIEEVMENK